MTNLSGANLNNGAAVGPQGEGKESPSTFPRYPAYKDSGVEWMGEVPAHWNVAPVGMYYEIRNGFPFSADNFSPEGAPEHRLIRIRDILGNDSPLYTDESCPVQCIVENGDILIGMDGDFNIASWAEGKAKLNQRVCAIRGSSFSWDRFFFYGIGAPLKIINDLTFATTVKHLASSQVLKTRFPIPPKTEVDNIARFLDHETTRIDALIEEQQRLIELLKEKRQAVISLAVTKGLDPTVPMKDSGVEWLGEVPAHWQVGALGYFAGIDTGATPDRGNPEYWGGDIPWIKTGEVNYENISQAEEHITSEGIKNSAAKVAPKGTLLMAMYGQGVTRGRVAILNIEAAYNQACAGIFVDGRVRVEYLRLFFIAAYPYIRDGGNETSQMNLSSGHIAKIKISVPPINEQISAEHFLNAEMVRFDSLISEAGLLAQYLQERRSALISAAVTGKIDVRGWQYPTSVPTPELAQEAM